MKTEIIANLKEFNTNHGILFTSEEDSEEYYKDLVELIEGITNKQIKEVMEALEAYIEAKPLVRGEGVQVSDVLAVVKQFIKRGRRLIINPQ